MHKKLTGKKVLQAAIMLGSFSMANSYAGNWIANSYVSNWDELPEDSSQINYTEGHIGAGTGAITGAVVGGPPGLVLGAIIGKFVGRDQGMQRHIDERGQQLQQLQAQLDNREKTITAFNRSKETQGVQVASMTNIPLQASADMASIIEHGIAYSIHFRTDSEQIEPHIIEQCRRFTALARLFPQLVVNLKGYADPRGESSYNLSLSERRLESVRQLLIEEGIDTASIQLTAKGEEELLSPEDDRDSHSFERRVVITFSQREERS